MNNCVQLEWNLHSCLVLGFGLMVMLHSMYNHPHASLDPSPMLISSQSCNRYVATSKALTSTSIPVPSFSILTSSRSSSSTFVFHTFLTGMLPHRSRPLLFPPSESKILTITLCPFRFSSSPKLTSSSSSPRLTQSRTKFVAPSMKKEERSGLTLSGDG